MFSFQFFIFILLDNANFIDWIKFATFHFAGSENFGTYNTLI